jgi:phosphatidate cytidylyltransferase
MIEFFTTNFGQVFLGILGVLVASTVGVWGFGWLRPSRNVLGLKLRVRSWWFMAVLFAVAISFHLVVSLVFFAFISFLALKEYLSLIPTRRTDRGVLSWVYLAIPLQYLWVGLEWFGIFLIFIPVFMFLFLPVRMLLFGETTGFLRAAGTLHWGLMAAVFSLSHAAYLLVLPWYGNPNGGGAGLLLYLVLLTQANDLSQYIFSTIFNRSPVVTKVSSHKTWGGLIGGVSTTVVLALVLAPVLTPMGIWGSFVAGIMIGLAGFFGDLTISALKRDLGIKSTGNFIPGHGGVLDQVDSLTYTAPLFLHYIRYLYY